MPLDGPFVPISTDGQTNWMIAPENGMVGVAVTHCHGGFACFVSVNEAVDIEKRFAAARKAAVRLNPRLLVPVPDTDDIPDASGAVILGQ